jgi:ABC-2 type transport system permease protein
MRKTWIVIKTEIINTITRRSFLLALILVPLIPALILGAITLFGGDDVGQNLEAWSQPNIDAKKAEGYVDRAGLITALPEGLDQNILKPYSSVDEANKAISSGEIGGYYIIDSSFIETGEIEYFLEEFNTFSALETTGLIEAVIRFNLLGANPDRFETFSNPVRVEYIDIEPETEETGMSSPLAFYVPYGMAMLFYVLIITSASLLMNSVAKEKENRVIEILMSSITPRQLLTGKIIGLGIVGLLQMLLWTISAYFLLRAGGRTFNFAENLQLGPEIIFWGIFFFLLGYLIYATLMAGVGALVTNIKEATQATFYIIIPIIIPLMFISVIIEQPNATLPLVLSLIPFTAPITIMTRVAIGPVPVWQLIIAILLMLGTAILLIRAVSNLFRAQTLLTGRKFSLKLYLRALSGKTLDSQTTN